MIVLRAKDVDFEVTYINLRDKPDWFLAFSPHGKVPVLQVDEQPLFESNAIAEFLEETVAPPLHPQDPIKRARNRAWTDFVPGFSADLGGVYYSPSKEALPERLGVARTSVGKLEAAIAKERGDDGPFFNGPSLCLVDAAYAPFFQRFALVDAKLETGLLDAFPQVHAWSDALLGDERITGSVAETFEEKFIEYLHRREAYAWSLFAGEGVAAS